MKKIMMVSSVHVWNDTRIFFKEAISLAENGYLVDFYALDYSANKKEIKNLKMHYLKPEKRISRWKNWLFLFREIKNKAPDIVHFHDSELLFIPILLKKNKKTMTIYDMHEHLPAAILTKPWINKKVRFLVSRMVKVIEKKLMKSCDAVIFAEKSYKENYQELTIKKADVLNYPKQMIRRDNIVKEDRFTLIYCGVLIKQRGLWEMLNLAKLLADKNLIPNFQLKLIGPLLNEHDNVEKFILKNKLEEIVYFYGRQPYDQIWEHYHTSHLGLCFLHPTPNNLNSFSTKLYEYMNSGLPSIASNFPQFEKLLTENDCGQTVDLFNTKEISEVVVRYYQDVSLLTRQSENGLKSKYDWYSQEIKLLELYSEVIKDIG